MEQGTHKYVYCGRLWKVTTISVNAIESCAISVAILVATCSLGLPIVSSSVGVLNMAAQQSADFLLNFLPKKKKERFTH